MTWKGTLLHIHVAPQPPMKMEALTQAQLVPGRGIVGDRYFLGTGGTGKMIAQAKEALKAKQFQWGAELADHVLVLDTANVAAKEIKATALAELGERQVNATARNYYLTLAQFLLKERKQK